MPTTVNGYRAVFAAPRKVILEPQEFAPPKAGQVLLRTERTLISTGTELTALTGDFPANSSWAAYIKYPCGVGRSNVATVLEVGEGVEKVKIGDRVASSAAHASHAHHDADYLRPIPPGVNTDVRRIRREYRRGTGGASGDAFLPSGGRMADYCG